MVTAEQSTPIVLTTISQVPEDDPSPGFIAQNPWVAAIGTVTVIVVTVVVALLVIKIRKRSRYDYSALKEHKALPLKIEMMNKLQQDMVRDEALLSCSFYLRSSGQYRLIDHLPTIGWRKDKHWFLVKHKDANSEKLLSIIPRTKRFPLQFTRNSFNTLQFLFQAVKHPNIMPVWEVGFQEDNEQIIVIRDYQPNGSLKDLIYNSRCLNGWHSKYKEQGEPVPIEQIQLYGKQILQALLYLHESGFPYFIHLHSGNIILKDGICRLSGYENSLFGLDPKHGEHLKPIYKHNLPFFDSVCFGGVIFEMATGTELKGAFPSIEDIAKLQQLSDIKQVIEYIFNVENLPTLQMISKHRFFRLKGSTTPIKSKHAHLSSAAKSLLRSVRKGKLFRMRSTSKLKPHDVTVVTIETEMTPRRESVSSKGSNITAELKSKTKPRSKSVESSGTDVSQTSSSPLSFHDDEEPEVKQKRRLVLNPGHRAVPSDALSTERSALMVAIRTGTSLKKTKSRVEERV